MNMTSTLLLTAISLGQFHSPQIDDPQIRTMIYDERTYWFDSDTMPRVYQQAVGNTNQAHVISVHYNISGGADRFGKGNGNLEFPWDKPGGTNHARNIDTNTFVWLPKGKPIVAFSSRSHRDVITKWVFPHGAFVGEVLMQKWPGEGVPIVWEIRIREREADAWGVDILRPFPERQDLIDALKSRGEDKLATYVAGAKKEPMSIEDSIHPRRAFKRRVMTEMLPNFPLDLSKDLLTSTTFKSALGTDWTPTSAQTHSIVPRYYLGALLGSDRDSCMGCHRDTGKHVDLFGPPGRDWYGHIRGSDGILSFHPFAHSSISTTGVHIPIRLNRGLVRRGIVAWYNPRVHTVGYNQLK